MKRPLLTICSIITLLLLPVQVKFAHAEEIVSIELNKMQPAGEGCRVFLVFMNSSTSAFESFKPDLVFFDKDGVIGGRLAIEGGPLPIGKTRVKLFDVAKMKCAAIGQVLLNDIRACTGTLNEPTTCLAMTQPSSRIPTAFIK